MANIKFKRKDGTIAGSIDEELNEEIFDEKFLRKKKEEQKRKRREQKLKKEEEENDE